MKNKIFGIGLNKTGTTSIGYYFKQLGINIIAEVIIIILKKQKMT